MNIKSLLSLMLIALFGAGLVACGGGSSSGGAGGGSGSSANLVVKVNGGSASLQTGNQATRVAALISEFLIEDAQASQPEGHTVVVFDFDQTTALASGITDEFGEVALAVPPNEPGEFFYVCFDGAVPPACPTVVVGEGEVVVANATQNLTTGDWELTQDNVGPAPAEDHPEAFQDPDNDQKTIICHIPPGNPDNAKTLSVGTPAVDAHMNHGDTLGPCPDDDGTGGGDDDDDDDDDDDV